ncbi:MAG: hypothetical protein JWM11_1937 [Planctomycetaceae bacterium]|nr:hypothetical protein [Planctomycetaceae bacterium]
MTELLAFGDYQSGFTWIVLENRKMPGEAPASTGQCKRSALESALHKQVFGTFHAVVLASAVSDQALQDFRSMQQLKQVGRPRQMYYLYGSKPSLQHKLVATFDSHEQLLAYVGWATLSKSPAGISKFEQGSALAGYQCWEQSGAPLTDEDPEMVNHNPSPSML